MDQVLYLVALGGLLGATGQALRMVMGLKKQHEEARAASPPKKVGDWFDGKKLGISFILGVVAGVLAAVTQWTPDISMSRDLMMGFIAAGYSGADFIDGLMSKWLP